MTQPDQDNAYAVLTQMLQEWGLASLGPEVLRLLQEGYTQTQIPVLLQDTDAYKQRFAGNQVRKQKGLAVLSPAEYLQTERSYRQIMSNAGLPEGFYDSPSDFADFIGLDVSPVEVQRRVGEAVDSAYRADDNTKAVWAEMGLTPDDMVAWVLDQQRGRDELSRIVRGGRIGGAARGAGVNLARSQMERFGLMATDDYIKEAAQFGTLAGVGEKLSGLYEGEDYGAEEAAAEVWQASTEAERRRKKLFALEQGEFSEGAGAGRTSLTQGPGGY